MIMLSFSEGAARMDRSENIRSGGRVRQMLSDKAREARLRLGLDKYRGVTGKR